VGGVTSFDVQESAIPRYTKEALAQYSTPLEARNAVRDLHGSTIPGLEVARLYPNQRISAGFMIKPEVYNVVRAYLDVLRHHPRVTNFVMSKIPKLSSSFKVRVQGEDVQCVVKMGRGIEQILAGPVAMNGGQPVWHNLFLRSDGLRYLAELPTRKCTRKCLHPTRLLQKAVVDLRVSNHQQGDLPSLIAKIEMLRMLTLQAPARIWRKLHGGPQVTATTIQESFAFLNIARKDFTKAWFFRGSDLSKADISISLTRATFTADGSADQDKKISCAVCLAKPIDPYETRCGHAFCSGSLVDQCSQGSDLIQFPVQRLGDLGQLSHGLGMEELEGVLSTTVFERQLKSSFDQ